MNIHSKYVSFSFYITTTEAHSLRTLISYYHMVTNFFHPENIGPGVWCVPHPTFICAVQYLSMNVRSDQVSSDIRERVKYASLPRQLQPLTCVRAPWSRALATSYNTGIAFAGDEIGFDPKVRVYPSLISIQSYILLPAWKLFCSAFMDHRAAIQASCHTHRVCCSLSKLAVYGALKIFVSAYVTLQI